MKNKKLKTYNITKRNREENQKNYGPIKGINFFVGDGFNILSSWSLDKVQTSFVNFQRRIQSSSHFILLYYYHCEMREQEHIPTDCGSVPTKRYNLDFLLVKSPKIHDRHTAKSEIHSLAQNLCGSTLFQISCVRRQSCKQL